PEILLGAAPRGLRHTLAVGRVLREERDLELVRTEVEAVREVLGDELDVVPAEAGAVDLRTEDVLQAALAEARVHAGALPVDDVLARGRFAGGAAERGRVRAGDDLHAFARDEPVGF